MKTNLFSRLLISPALRVLSSDISSDSYLDSPNLTESAETNLLSSPTRSLSFFVINKKRFQYSKLCSFQGNACSSLAWSRALWTRTTTASWSGSASASPTSSRGRPGPARSWPGRRLKRVSHHCHHSSSTNNLLIRDQRDLWPTQPSKLDPQSMSANSTMLSNNIFIGRWLRSNQIPQGNHPKPKSATPVHCSGVCVCAKG